LDTANLSKVLKDAMKSGKCVMGAKECIAGMKGAKALLFTRSVPLALGKKLRDEAERHSIPVVELPLTSADLAKMVNKPYKVSALTLRGIGEADLKLLLR
jgi:ribosomal protein L30E